MFSLQRAVVAGGLILWLGAGALAERARQDPPPPTPTPPANAPGPQRFAGAWDYNDEESVNAATGRPEQGPRSATERSGAAAGRAPRSGGRGAPGGAGGPGGTGGPGGAGGPGDARVPGGFGGSSGRGSSLILAETRSLVRDLLEVPESLTLKVTADAVTFIDDLERERTYPTNGKKQKYQLGAAAFEAKAWWDGVQLRKEIEAAYGFKMTETYFLSADGRKMFVIVRIGDQSKKPPVVGVNRVYDRVQ